MGNRGKRILYLTMFAVMIALASPVGVFTAQAAPQVFNLTIIHTNDFHDYDPIALARKATIIKKNPG